MFAKVFESIRAGTWPSELLALANTTYVATWKNRPQNVYNLAAIAVALLIVFFSIRLGMAYLKSEIGKGRFAASASSALNVPGGARHEEKSSEDMDTASDKSPVRSSRSRKAAVQPKKAVAAVKVAAPKKAAAIPKKAVAKKVVEPKKSAPVRSVSPPKRIVPAKVATPVRATPARATPVRAARAASPAKSAARSRSASRGASKSTRSRK